MADDLTEVCDRLQDHTREVSKLVKALMAREVPVVNVAPPTAQVRVEAPHVTTPVRIEKELPQRWEFDITRDGNGFMKKVTATPVQ